jgi:hypothetical protein
VASTHREIRGSRVGAEKTCVKVCEVMRGDILATTVERVEPQSKWKIDGIEDWRIGDPASVGSTHSISAKSEFSIGEKDHGLVGHMSPMKGVS